VIPTLNELFVFVRETKQWLSMLAKALDSNSAVSQTDFDSPHAIFRQIWSRLGLTNEVGVDEDKEGDHVESILKQVDQVQRDVEALNVHDQPVQMVEK
jgi:hypothetical protein